MQRPRAPRHALTALLSLGLVLGAAGTASAHVEVNSSTAQALAVDATVTFSVEGESSTAGIKDVKVTLPAGLAPADVSSVTTPDGWKFTPTADGFALEGPALAPGAAAEYSVKIRQLPAAASVVFKTLVDYSDGHTDRWIELAQGDAKPEHPAPALALRPAAAGASALPAAVPSSSAPAAEASVSSVATAPAAASPSASSDPVAKSDDNGESTTTIVLGGLVAVAVLGTVIALLVRRRSRRSGR
ncbi:DUF1775 domain-containing protein [Kitasatospora sp. CB01950]|uniref:DUF1775 domain-containing protein n=1 Tax=Kitasatospora sp. CB01950 TaxID=1703930 RepID=UPI00093E0CBC|nr:DUF1775 domain-containing protein [Kitasatospora sp. CB01950]OKJ05271.1 hypothetical protein AMK19_26170 [Kitasatospora sp. CB01950]